MTGRIYTVLVTAILLFPWSVVGLMVMGTLWDRGKVYMRSGPEAEETRTPEVGPGGSWLNKQS